MACIPFHSMHSGEAGIQECGFLGGTGQTGEIPEKRKTDHGFADVGDLVLALW